MVKHSSAQNRRSTYVLRLMAIVSDDVRQSTVRLLIAFLGNRSQKSLPRKAFLGKPRPPGRLAGRPAKRPAERPAERLASRVSSVSRKSM